MKEGGRRGDSRQERGRRLQGVHQGSPPVYTYCFGMVNDVLHTSLPGEQHHTANTRSSESGGENQ